MDRALIYKLFLDDERNPISTDWIVVRDFDSATECINVYGFPIEVSLDHDLGMGETGYDFVKWLVEHDLKHNDMPENFIMHVHSQNPVGKNNMEQYLKNYMKFKNNQI